MSDYNSMETDTPHTHCLTQYQNGKWIVINSSTDYDPDCELCNPELTDDDTTVIVCYTKEDNR